MKQLTWKFNLVLILIALFGAGLVTLCLLIPFVRGIVLLLIAGIYIHIVVKG